MWQLTFECHWNAPLQASVNRKIDPRFQINYADFAIIIGTPFYSHKAIFRSQPVPIPIFLWGAFDTHIKGPNSLCFTCWLSGPAKGLNRSTRQTNFRNSFYVTILCVKHSVFSLKARSPAPKKSAKHTFCALNLKPHLYKNIAVYPFCSPRIMRFYFGWTRL